MGQELRQLFLKYWQVYNIWAILFALSLSTPLDQIVKSLNYDMIRTPMSQFPLESLVIDNPEQET